MRANSTPVQRVFAEASQANDIKASSDSSKLGSIVLHVADLNSLASIEKFAHEFNSLNIALHVLINNAGFDSLFGQTCNHLINSLHQDHAQ